MSSYTPPSSHRQFGRIKKRSLFYTLAIGSGLLGSLWVILDTLANSYITDPYLFGSYEMVVGFVASLVLVAILHIPLKRRDPHFKRTLGYYFDPNFQGLMLPKGKALVYTLLAGGFATGNTIFYFILLKKYDASVIVPFSQFVLVYLLIGDSISDKEKPVMIEIQSIVMIAFGVIIATLSGGNIDLLGIILIFGPFSLFSAAYIYYQKKALSFKTDRQRPLDTMSLRIWTMLIMTVGQVIATIPTIINKGIDEINENWKPALLPVIGSMLLVYVGVVAYTRALTMGKMSIVRALNSISVIGTFPLEALFAIWYPAVFMSGENSMVSVVLKISGAILILTGMVTLALADTRSVVLAKIKLGEKIELEELIKMKGVESVAYVSGAYDLIIFIRLRNIGKTYNLIRKSISKLPWIESVITLPIMREYT